MIQFEFILHLEKYSIRRGPGTDILYILLWFILLLLLSLSNLTPGGDVQKNAL